MEPGPKNEKPEYVRTTPETEQALHASLAEAINAWLNGDAADAIFSKSNLGYISEDVESRMATAALAVLLAQNDVEVYLYEQGYLEKADEPLVHSEN